MGLGGNTATTTTKGTNMTTTTTPPQCWRDFDEVLASGLSRVCLYGNPGTGKTYAALTEHLNERGSTRLVCVDDMTSAQIEGMWRPSRDGWAFQEGAAVTAWRNGSRLVIDEIDKASGDVLGTLLAFCDSEQSARWQNPDTGEIVTPREGFSIVITTNSHPNALAEALRDRFPVAIEITEPHPNAIALLPNYLREPARMLAGRTDEARVSIRAFMALDHLSNSVGIERAAALVMPQHAEAIVTAHKINAIGGEA